MDGERREGNIELLFTPQPDPDGDRQTLSVEVSTSAAFAADVTKIFSSGIQRKNPNGSWSNSTQFTTSDVGTQYRYVLAESNIPGPDVYFRVGTIDTSGRNEKVYSQTVCVHIGTQLEVQGNGPDNRGAVRPEKCVLYPMSTISPGAEAHFYVCNNGLDAEPTWEETVPGEIHTFTNAAKTAENWALNWKVTVNAGTATGPIQIGPQVALGTI